MLFNSYVFLLVFFPAALALHWLAETFRPSWRLPVLVALSVVFYGYWDVRFVPLLVISITVNWVAAELFLHTRRSSLIAAAIVANLLVLAFFKYYNFLVYFNVLIEGLGLNPPRSEIPLPLGISFFTFHHIMYLTDLRAGRAPRLGLVQYALYIAFFPQVLAGPLVRWMELVPQLDERPYCRPDGAKRFAVGLMLLVVGLAKKVFLGDPLAGYVNPVFAQAVNGQVPTLIEAWQATLGFTFQIYFDFSGYTDMALGIALMLGIVLPQNFDVPYRAVSLRDFWRRWHMTLSRFLRDYLYIPLGGSRRGLAVQLWALFATMALGGLWHGAGMTFVAWGMAHGIGLGAGVLWRRAGWRMPLAVGWAATALFVILTWVLFRAPTFSSAVLVYQGLLGLTPAGVGAGWGLLAAAAAVALIGPTSWAAVHRVPPSPFIAVAFAAVFLLILLKLGGPGNVEFIYFQF
jgi:alginate O-acetyltransferase complex protein AlgI